MNTRHHYNGTLPVLHIMPPSSLLHHYGRAKGPEQRSHLPGAVLVQSLQRVTPAQLVAAMAVYDPPVAPDQAAVPAHAEIHRGRTLKENYAMTVSRNHPQIMNG